MKTKSSNWDQLTVVYQCHSFGNTIQQLSAEYIFVLGVIPNKECIRHYTQTLVHTILFPSRDKSTNRFGYLCCVLQPVSIYTRKQLYLGSLVFVLCKVLRNTAMKTGVTFFSALRTIFQSSSTGFQMPFLPRMNCLGYILQKLLTQFNSVCQNNFTNPITCLCDFHGIFQCFDKLFDLSKTNLLVFL